MKTLKYTLSLLGLIIIGLLSNCSDCPPSEELGKVYLQDSSLMFHLYRDNETLTFVNKEGDKKIFKAGEYGNNDEDHRIFVEEICDAGPLLLNSNAFYFSEQYERAYEFESDNIYYSAHVSALSQNRDTVLYDVFSLSGYISNNDIQSLRIITSERGRSLGEARDTLYESYDYVSDTTLHDHKFENVYYSIGDDTAFLFALNVGIVAINDGNELWVIDK